MSGYADDDSPHVLILRLWRETGTSDDAEPEWRALIEDVSTSQRFPVRDMRSLQALLAPYRDDIGLDDFLTSEETRKKG